MKRINCWVAAVVTALVVAAAGMAAASSPAHTMAPAVSVPFYHASFMTSQAHPSHRVCLALVKDWNSIGHANTARAQRKWWKRLARDFGRAHDRPARNLAHDISELWGNALVGVKLTKGEVKTIGQAFRLERREIVADCR